MAASAEITPEMPAATSGTQDISPPRWQTLDLLYRGHHGWLFGWLRKKLGCPHHAEDLAHDTFMRMAASKNPIDLRQPRAFLTTIAKGLVIDHYRRAALERAYLEELAAMPEALHPSPEEQALMLETLREVDRLFSSLSVKARTAFLCNRIDGMSHAEIAIQLGVSVPRVRQYLAQGLRQCCRFFCTVALHFQSFWHSNESR